MNIQSSLIGITFRPFGWLKPLFVDRLGYRACECHNQPPGYGQVCGLCRTPPQTMPEKIREGILAIRTRNVLADKKWRKDSYLVYLGRKQITKLDLDEKAKSARMRHATDWIIKYINTCTSNRKLACNVQKLFKIIIVISNQAMLDCIANTIRNGFEVSIFGNYIVYTHDVG